MIVLGIDIGGTQVKAGMVDDEGAILASRAIRTPPDVDSFMPALQESIHWLTEAVGPAAGVGIGCKGIINPDSTKVEILPGTLHFLEGLRLSDIGFRHYDRHRLPPWATRDGTSGRTPSWRLLRRGQGCKQRFTAAPVTAFRPTLPSFRPTGGKAEPRRHHAGTRTALPLYSAILRSVAGETLSGRPSSEKKAASATSWGSGLGSFPVHAVNTHIESLFPSRSEK